RAHGLDRSLCAHCLRHAARADSGWRIADPSRVTTLPRPQYPARLRRSTWPGGWMSDWIEALPVGWMGAVVFGGTFLVAGAIYWIVMHFAREERARAFKGVSPGLLPPLGIIFGLLVAFVAAQVWGDNDRANAAVNREASALRAVVLLSRAFPGDADTRMRGLITRHIREATDVE